MVNNSSSSRRRIERAKRFAHWIWHEMNRERALPARWSFLRPLAFADTRRMLGQKAGSALMMAIFSVTLLMVIATEIMYESSVEYLVSSQGVNQVKAYYAAKAGAELSLLRVHIYKKALAAFGDALPDKSMLDPIWQIPFAWPPAVPEDTSAVDKDQIQSAVKKSDMKSQYLATIESEGSKIDINDLASPSKVVAEATRQQILQIFKGRIEAEDKWADEYRNYDFEKLVNNIADWVDEDKESRNGGDEQALYPDIRSEVIPPNQPFKTVGELHMVATMTDALFEILAPRITVYGIKGINVNYASKEVLQSLTPQITAERAGQIVEARNDPKRGPFKNSEDFVGYLNSIGVQGNPFSDGKQETIPLIFDAEYNFRIKASGVSGQVKKDIIAIVYDFDRVRDRLGEMMKKEDQQNSQNQQQNQNQNQNQAGNQNGTNDQNGQQQNQQQNQKKKYPMPKERPTVVYWIEG